MNNTLALAEALKKKQEAAANTQNPQPTPVIQAHQIISGYDVGQQMSSLAKQIKAERINKGLTQRTLAKMCLVSQGTIARAESGRGDISYYTFCKIITGLKKVITLTDTIL